jgi:hypothetical protein
MISENGEFVWFLPKERRIEYASYPEYLEHNGKWIIYGQKEFIEGLGSKMLELVGKDDILQAKFTRKPALDVPEGYVLGRDHALIVYCDDRKRRMVKGRLKKELGVDEMFWKYDRQTIEEVLKSKCA